ncbi:3955_t:CDS:2, partial [Ambispora gerdemannii]
MPPARIMEEMLKESNKEENNVNDIIHTVAATEHSNSKIEHISDASRIEVDYLDTHLLVHLDIAITQNKMIKEMADLIITEVEDRDDYSWKVDIYHESFHPHPNLCIEMPNELWEEIKTHSHLTVVDLKNHLRRQRYNISKYSPKHIYFWKSITNQKLFQCYDDHIESACKLLTEHNSHVFHWCLDIRYSKTTAIGFTTPLLDKIQNYGINITEIYMDVTYKTARGCYELY